MIMNIPGWLSKTVIVIFIVTLFLSLAFGGPFVGSNIFVGWFEAVFPTYDSMPVDGGMVLGLFLVFIIIMYLVIKLVKIIWTALRRATKNR